MSGMSEGRRNFSEYVQCQLFSQPVFLRILNLRFFIWPVETSINSVGGFVKTDWTDCSITNCYAATYTGNYIGGLAGNNDQRPSISNCYDPENVIEWKMGVGAYCLPEFCRQTSVPAEMPERLK